MKCALVETFINGGGLSTDLRSREESFLCDRKSCHPMVIPSAFYLLGSGCTLVIRGRGLARFVFSGWYFKGLSMRAGSCSVLA